MIPALQLAEAVLVALREHLGMPRHARVIDPLIVAMSRAVATRFRRQGGWYQRSGSLHGFADPKFRKRAARILQRAYDGGGNAAGADLGQIKEAAVNPQRIRAYLPAFSAIMRVADLESQIDATTAEEIAHQSALAGAQAGSRIIRRMFRDWSHSSQEGRAAMIGLTEVSAAYHAGSLAMARLMRQDDGTEVLKSWITEDGACEICEENAADGPIPVDSLFASGDDSPGAHPHCRCSLEFSQAGSTG